MVKSNYLGIADIAGQYVKLTPEGPSHFIGKCPFCAAEEDSLILSVDTQYWHCLSCGANGDRYDFVARSENIGRAEAILMVGHHTNSGEPFPHARFKPAPPSPAAEPPKVAPAAATAAAAPAPKPPEPPPATAAPAAPAGPALEQALAAAFLQFRNIIPSYQGAALFDDKSRMILGDSGYSLSADLGAVVQALAPILAQAAAVFSKWGINAAGPGTVTLSSENLAILVYKFGPGQSRQLMVRLQNPSDAAVARRLVASASARLT